VLILLLAGLSCHSQKLLPLLCILSHLLRDTNVKKALAVSGISSWPGLQNCKGIVALHMLMYRNILLWLPCNRIPSSESSVDRRRVRGTSQSISFTVSAQAALSPHAASPE